MENFIKIKIKETKTKLHKKVTVRLETFTTMSQDVILNLFRHNVLFVFARNYEFSEN